MTPHKLSAQNGVVQGAKSSVAPYITNTSGAERDNCPITSPDGTVMYFNSTRKGTRTWGQFDSISQRYDDDIYYIKHSPNGWSQPINLGQPVNSSEDDGISAMSPDGHIIYFVSLRPSWRSDGGPFYQAYVDNTPHGTTWSQIQGLGDGITRFFQERDRTKRFRVYGATISPDGKDFYFATTVNSPTGDHQLWVSHCNAAGQWEYPENLGGLVNADGGSFSPYIAPDNKTLYFASRREGGYGGDDIYVTVKGHNGNWSVPRNLGPEINTYKDEAFPSLSSSGNQLFISTSVRGKETISTAPVDLPLQFRPTPTLLISGTIIGATSGKPVESVITVENLRTGKLLSTAASNRRTGVYAIVLLSGGDYGISFNSQNYFFFSDRYSLPDMDSSDITVRNVSLPLLKSGERFEINNIFFDYNKTAIRSESMPELTRLITLFQLYPNLRVQISGHADNTGTSSYNLKLSLQRAQVVRNYLVKVGGVDPSRLLTQGYGADYPVATNETEPGRQRNRRTEFFIVEM